MQSALIIDADDTLWESNVFFEKAIEQFLFLVESRGGERELTRQRLELIERRNVPRYGYGSREFTRSLNDTFRDVLGVSPSVSEYDQIYAFGETIRAMPIKCLPGVRETLKVLNQFYRLILFTKGDINEQNNKVLRSGVKSYFYGVEITEEKDSADYRRLLQTYEIDRDASWMIGNSPRSDINPALKVGLGAVYIPNAQTWGLEQEKMRMPTGARLKVLKCFSELIEHFCPKFDNHGS